MTPRKKSLAHQVADQLVDLIVSEEAFSPGDQLPGENVLSEQLGVSRNTLREAIRILASQGVLEVYRGKGTFVANNIPTFGDYGLGQIDHMHTRLKDLYEVRLVLEPQMAALACQRASDEELAQIIKYGKAVERAIKRGVTGQKRIEADQKFHGAIVEASHNRFISELLPFINAAIDAAITLGSPIERTLSDYTLKDHALIMEFLKERDAEGAKGALTLHLHHGIKHLELNEDEHPIF